MGILLLLCSVCFVIVIVYLQSKKQDMGNTGLTNTLCFTLGFLAICALVLSSIFFRLP